ncbi:MAG: DNA repair protein RecO [Kiritimatiellia bacterium]|jgi:DNA repair protein RecO (recombination protein O)|nr:DNA repair protein RecO [Kiritimatiellia bacterium]MDP6809134.1 DNA repair protein RecO [Kiritimatiellia bacterium]MDP7023174.1 DNA repair protein RecO [Kiritimatiellia bacterium]
MITKTNAIVLRVAPYSRTSHVVTWLTESAGRVSTVVKGAVRPKSSFLGQYDLGYTCELLFYERARNGLHVAKECSPLEMRSGLRSDWQAFVAASYICDLVLGVALPTHDGQESTYALLGEALDALCERRLEPAVLLNWFELRLLHVLGYAPHLERCVSCGADLAQQKAGFDAAHGGSFCLNCLPQPVARQVVAVGPDTQSVLRRWSSAPSPELLRNMVLNQKQLLALRAVTGTMLAYCLERRPESRDVAVATLGWKQGEM